MIKTEVNDSIKDLQTLESCAIISVFCISRPVPAFSVANCSVLYLRVSFLSQRKEIEQTAIPAWRKLVVDDKSLMNSIHFLKYSKPYSCDCKKSVTVVPIHETVGWFGQTSCEMLFYFGF